MTILSRPWYAAVAILLLTMPHACAQERPAAYAQPKFCNIVLADTDMNLDGMQRFIGGAKARGLWGRFKLTILLHPDSAAADKPGQREFYRGLHDEGHEIGVFFAGGRPAIAKWLGIPEAEVTTIGFELFGDVDTEEQARASQQGFRATVNACIEGDSMLEERWDIPHNWEGAPYLPYWVQWDADRPADTARVNREMTKKQAALELQWATRTMWHNYDRICLPQCFHFGEPLKHSQWPFQQLAHRGDIWWWRAEIDELEANLSAGRTPLLYLNTASEANIFSPSGPWAPMLDTEEALSCALDLVALLLDRHWNLVTVREFTDYYAKRWPCPTVPSAAYLMNDTLAGRPDKQGLVVPSHGRLLHAETQHFQIVDHEHRMSPEIVVAYDLQTPNLLRGGYTFGDPDQHGAGQNPGQYSATTGNALFWSPSAPLANAKGVPYYHSAKPADARDRTFTLYLGDEWEPYQFAEARFINVTRRGSEVAWTKEMLAPVAGTDTKLRYTHRLVGSEHRVEVEVLGKDAVGKPVRLRLCPYFHQGWDTDYAKPGTPRPATIADPKSAGQERNVFARVGAREFAFSETNPSRTAERITLAAGRARIDLFNRNPGRPRTAPGWTIDDNPAMNRGVLVTLDTHAAAVTLVDAPGPTHYVTAVVDLGPHRPGAKYRFTFTYWHGDGKAGMR